MLLDAALARTAVQCLGEASPLAGTAWLGVHDRLMAALALAPIDGDETNAVTEDTALVVANGAAGDLLNNGADPDGNPLTISSYTVAGVAGTRAVNSNYLIAGVGTIRINSNGSYSFTPLANFTGAIPVITYTVFDGTENDISTLTLSMVAVNDAPVDGNEAATLNEDTTRTVNNGAVGDLLNNATDVDGGPATITDYSIAGIAGVQTVGVPVVVAGVGTIRINADGSYSYTPAANVNGPVPVITYTVSDGNGGSNTSTLTLTVIAVNDAPVDGNEINAVAEDGALTVADGSADDLLGNATDAEGQALTITGYTIAGVAGVRPVGSDVLIAGRGTLRINADGSYSFTPLPNYAGTVPVITYTVSDGSGGTNTSTLTLSVTAVNDAPVDADEAAALNEDTTRTIANGAAGDLLNNSSDVDGAAATITGYTIAGVAGTQAVGVPVLITGVGTIRINADGSYSYTPAANVNGAVPLITYTVSDSRGGTDTSTLTLTVNPVNDAPVDGNETNTVAEDGALGVADGATGDLLNNATDVDGNPLSISGYTVVGMTGTQAVGVDVLIPGRGIMRINADGSYSFTPLANYAGTVPVITYTVADGGGGTNTSTLSLTVTAVNDAPVDADETAALNEDTNRTVANGAAGDLLNNSTDIDGAAPTITGYTIAGVAGTRAVGVPFVITGVGTIRINADGSYSYTPVANVNGAVPLITYTVSDGLGGTDTSTLTLTVNPVNDAPVDGNEAATLLEDNVRTVADGAAGDLLNNATDIDSSPLSISGYTVPGITGTQAVGADVLIPGRGTLRINADGSYSFTPLPNVAGAVPVITYTVTDGNGGTNTSTLTLSVTAVNDAPVASNASITVNEESVDTLLGLPAPTDVDSVTLTIRVTGLPTVGTVTLANGTQVSNGMLLTSAQLTGLLYDAPADLASTTVTSFTYTVSDGIAPAVTGTATITVQPVNDAPVADNTAITVDEESLNTPLGLAAPTDVDSALLSIVVTGLPLVGVVTLADGSVVSVGMLLTPAQLSGLLYDAPADLASATVTSFSYTVSDGIASPVTGTATITVNPVNDAPVASNSAIVVNEESLSTPLGLTAPTDVDSASLAIMVTGLPSVGTIRLDDGTVVSSGMALTAAQLMGLRYDAPPELAAVASTSFSYSVSDGVASPVIGTTTIAVHPVNDVPVVDATSLTVNEESTNTALGLAAPADPDSPALSITVTGLPTLGSIRLADGRAVTLGMSLSSSQLSALVYDAPAELASAASLSFSYSVSDGIAAPITGSATITVNPVNDSPVVDGSMITVDEESRHTPLGLTPPTDVDSGSLGITVTGLPSEGRVTLADGSAVVLGMTLSPTQLMGLLYDAPLEIGVPTTTHFTYTVADGVAPPVSGMAVIVIHPLEDGAVDGGDAAPLKDGADRIAGRGDIDALVVNPVRGPATGAVAQAVEAIQSLQSMASLTTGVVSQAAKPADLDPLVGRVRAHIAPWLAPSDLERRDQASVRVASVIAQDMGRLLDQHASDPAAQDVVERVGRSLGLGRDIQVEVFRRGQQDLIEVSDIAPEGTGAIVGMTLRMAEGGAVPKWIRLAGRGLLLVDRPAACEQVRLLLIIQRDGGYTRSHLVHIEPNAVSVTDPESKVIEGATGFAEQLDRAVSLRHRGAAQSGPDDGLQRSGAAWR